MTSTLCSRNPEKTSPYEFYQYWRNVDDADVIKCMKLLTFLPMEQINEYAKLEGQQLNTAKEVLAYELTNLVHGEEEAKKAQEAARAIFSGGANSANMPTTQVEADSLTGVSLNDEKVGDVYATVSKADLEAGAVVRKGKKVFRKFTL